MSQENVEIVFQGRDAMNRQDADAFVALASPDIEWEDAAFWSESTRMYRGKAELREWFARVVVEPWESVHFEVDEITEAADDRVLVGGLLTTRGKGSDVETQTRGWNIIWITNGKVTRRRVFLDRDEALEAAGLGE
jgi:ketosteroid isomerase-like protein